MRRASIVSLPAFDMAVESSFSIFLTTSGEYSFVHISYSHGELVFGPIGVSTIRPAMPLTHLSSRMSKNFAISPAPAPNIRRLCSSKTASTSVSGFHAMRENT